MKKSPKVRKKTTKRKLTLTEKNIRKVETLLNGLERNGMNYEHLFLGVYTFLKNQLLVNGDDLDEHTAKGITLNDTTLDGKRKKQMMVWFHLVTRIHPNDGDPNDPIDQEQIGTLTISNNS